ncbi:hypothetical protein RB601_005767 [Gaeumannomyces tritici]
MTNDPKTPHAWRRFILPLAAAMVPAGIGLTRLLTTQLRSYSEFKVKFLNNNRVNIQVAVQVAAAVLGGLQFYAVSSVLRFRTNARTFASDEGLAQGRRSGMTLDALKIRSAVVRGVMDFDLRWPVVLQILVWWLFLKSIAPMWAGTITPKLGQAQIPGVVNISNYDEASRSGWGTRCGPLDKCSDEFIPYFSKFGSFNQLPWKYSAGALQNVIATASTKTADDQTSRYPRLDNTGYWYSTRSYGVGMSAGLNQTRWTGRSGVIQSYRYEESGYWTNVECKRNVTSPEWWHIANFEDGSFTFTNSRAQMHLGWAWADLPNGNWSGSQVWSENESLNTTVVIANSNQRGRYMYGFVAGDAYPSLQGVQCSVIFKPTKFDILVNDTDKSIQVKPITGSNDDIDPSRDLVNNAFRSVSYLSQTMTTLYTSVLGDAFLDNIDMFFYQHENERLAETNGKIDATEMHVMRGIQDGLEVLLDQIFGILANGHRAAWWTHVRGGRGDPERRRHQVRRGRLHLHVGRLQPAGAARRRGRDGAHRLWRVEEPRAARRAQPRHPRHQVGHPGNGQGRGRGDAIGRPRLERTRRRQRCRSPHGDDGGRGWRAQADGPVGAQGAQEDEPVQPAGAILVGNGVPVTSRESERDAGFWIPVAGRQPDREDTFYQDRGGLICW